MKNKPSQKPKLPLDSVQNGIFFDNNPLPMWVYDLETYRFLSVNHAALVHYGYSENEFKAMTIKDIRPPEDVSRLVENVEHVTKGLDEAGVWRHLKKDGSLIFVEIVSHTIHYEGYDAELVVAMDVTDRKRAEWALREREEQFRVVFENAPIGIGVTDMQGNLLTFNDAMLIPGDYTRADIEKIGNVAALYYNPSDRSETLALFQQQGGVRGREVRFKRKDGSPYFASLSLTRMLFNGQPAVLAIVEDITERKQAEVLLSESEDRFRSYIQQANDYIFTLNSIGQITSANQVMCETLGYADSELVGMSALALAAPDRREEVAQTLRRIWNGESVDIFETPVQTQRGETILVQIRGRAIYKNGKLFETLHIARNVTAQKKAERDLVSSEERFRALIKNGRDNISLLAANGKLLWESPSNYSTLGYEHNQFVGHNIFELMHPDDIAWTQAMFEQVVQTPGESKEGVFRLRHNDGSWLWIEANASNLLDEQSVQAIVVNYRDITSRKMAEQALEQSQMQLDGVISSAMDAVITIDEEQRILLFNPSAEQMYQCAASEAIGQPLTRFIPEYVRGLHGQYVAEFGRSNATRRSMSTPTLELICLRANGEVFPAEISISHLELQGRKLYTAIIRDITERKQAEASLRLQSAALEAAVNSIVITDRRGAILWANSAYSRLTGYTLDEILGKNPRILRSGLHDKEFYKTMWDTILSGKAWHGELINKRKDGSLYHDEMTITPLIGENGEIAHFIGIKQDITERKKVEAEIHQRVRELETVNRISIALRASTNQEQALAIILEEILNVFDTRHGVISLWDPETELLNQIIARGWLVGITERPIRSGEGIFGTVFAEGEAHCSVEFASDPLTLPPSRSLLPLGWGGVCVPIRTSETILGVLTVAAPSNRVFHHEDIRLLETLAEMAGTALHRMSLNEALRRHLERLQSLRQIDIAITGSFDRNATLQTILTQVISQLGVSAADILMLDPTTQTLSLAAHKGFSEPLNDKTPLSIGESFAGIAISEYRMVTADLQTVRGVPAFYKLWQKEGFSNYHAIPLIVKDHPIGVLETYQRTLSTPNKAWFNFLEMLAGQAAIALENSGLFEDLENANAELMQAYDSTIEGWSHAMDLRDKETEGHTLRVTDLTLRLARAMGASPAEIIHIRRGALLHDIGKMGIPDRILLKPDKLTEEEWEIMRRHPTLALAMLEPIHYLKRALNIPYSHHEKWDGTGYPRGLAGEQIPLEARIFAVVDVWDALTSDRPYRPAWSKEKALNYIKEQSGKHFDPDVVYIFLRLGDEERGIGLQSGA